MNNIVRFAKGIKGNCIGHNNEGKIILSRNGAMPGYYAVSNIEEKDNFILADTKRVSYDYFPDITYNEFLSVLEYNGFTIGFIEDFHYVCGNYESDDHLIFAYDMKTHIVIVAESWNNGKCFNTIYVYCPGMNIFEHKSPLVIYGNCNYSVFNLTSQDVYNRNLGVIHILKNNMQPIMDRGDNVYKNESIKLWNYAEKYDSTNLDDFYENSDKKIKRANQDDMLKLFAQSETMMKALK